MFIAVRNSTVELPRTQELCENRRVAKNDAGSETQGWDAELVRRFGAAAKSARGRRSARWLSERTKELGYPISPTVIAKLDSGHRGTTLQVAEVLVIADALDISPVQLLFPGIPAGEVEVVPGLTVTAQRAANWFSGETPLPMHYADRYRRGGRRIPAGRQSNQTEAETRKNAWQQNTLPVRLARQAREANRDALTNTRLAENARQDGNSALADSYMELARVSYGNRDDAYWRMHELGLPIPNAIAQRLVVEYRDDASSEGTIDE